jgi:quercetin dioxygenase-like cupin family protein
MSDETTDLSAAEYVLGTLPRDRRRRVARELPGNAELRAAVEGWERRLAPLGTVVGPIAPPAGLWRKIEEAAVASPAPTSVTLRADEGSWRPVAEGAEKKILFIDDTAGFETFLLRLGPGGRLPPHDHAGAEECYMLQGEMWIGDLRLTAGDYHLAPAGTRHEEIVSRAGALVLVHTAIGEFTH